MGCIALMWGAIALLWLFNSWWGIGTGLDGSRDVHVLGHYALLAILPILLFLMCASVLPRAIPDRGRFNMRDEWPKNRGIFLAIFATYQVVIWIVVTVANGKIVLDFASLVRTVVFLVAVGALYFRSRRFEWTAALSILAIGIARISIQVTR